MTDKATDVTVTQADRLLVDRFDNLEWLSEDGRQNPAALDLAARHRTTSEQPASGEVALREALEAIVTRSNNDRIGTAKVIDMRNIASAALSTTSEAPAHSGEGRSNGAGEGVTNGQFEGDDFSPAADIARHIASYCEGDARRNVYHAAKKALSTPQGDDKTILKELRPSKKAMEKIDRIAQANAAGMAALRDMPLGSTAPQGDGEVERLREAYMAGWNDGFVQGATEGMPGVEPIQAEVSWSKWSTALAQPEAGGE